MYSILVFRESDADEMCQLGYRMLEKKADTSDSYVWVFAGKPEDTKEDIDKLPQSAVTTDSVCMNF